MPDFLESAEQSSTENKTSFFKKSFSSWAPNFNSHFLPVLAKVSACT